MNKCRHLKRGSVNPILSISSGIDMLSFVKFSFVFLRYALQSNHLVDAIKKAKEIPIIKETK